MTPIRCALVAGATGFIGSSLVRRLLAENIQPICLVRHNSANSSRVAEIRGARIIEVLSLRLPELESALRGVSAEFVFNLASYGVHPEHNDPDLLIKGNVGVVTSLLQVASRWPLRKFVHAGSCSEYGFPSHCNPIQETEPLAPASLYGAAKAASVLYGSALASMLGLPFVTLRLFGVFGIGEAPHRLIPYILQRLQQDELVDLTPGEQVRDLLYVDDVVEACLAAAQGENLPSGGVYNVCSGRPVRVRKVGEAVAAALHKPESLLLWGKRPYRNNEPMWLVGDNSRFRQATSWSPCVSLGEGISRIAHAATTQSQYCPG